MPKTTFFNLPEEKRQMLIDIAVDEFASHPYGVASISKIVERAGIAKGSIYQYFVDKEDFYLYLVEVAIERQMALLTEFVGGAEGDLFAQLRWQMSATLRVGLAAPQLMRLLRRAVESDPPLRQGVDRIIGSASDSHFLRMIEYGVARGEIDPGLDADLAAYVIRQVTGDVAAFLVRRLGLTVEAVADDLALLQSPAVEEVYDGLISILRSGLARPATTSVVGGGNA